ncbi:MAG TPA: DUF4412 domain-containing protein [Thermoanaerobaculia bacterium]|jgi:hypothetical protein|nr:DUF4412 domain-containing protein [Thermoanaerobaculia bacterium]
MLRRAVLPILLCLFAATAGVTGADSLFTVKSHTDAFQVAGQKQPAKDLQVKIWISGDKMRRDDGEQSMIVRLDRSRLYMINHETRTYHEIPLPIDLRKMMPKGSEAMADQIANGMKLTVQVTPKNETKKINQWNAKRYDVAIQSAMGMKIASTLWVSKEIDGYIPLNKLSATIASLQPGSTAWARELEKIDGYPVLQEASIDALGAKFGTREELLAVEDKPAPAGTFEPPAGYTAQPYNPIPGMSR